MKKLAISANRPLLSVFKHVLFFILLFSGRFINAQEPEPATQIPSEEMECFTQDPTQDPKQVPCNDLIFNLPEVGCDDFSKYAPIVPEYTPLRNVRLVVHVIQRDAGLPARNFQNTPEHIAIIDEVIEQLNWMYSELIPLSQQVGGCPSDLVVDSRVRFIRDSPVLFHQDSDFWDQATAQNCNVYDFWVTHNPDGDFPPGSELIDNAIHLFIEGVTFNQNVEIHKFRGYSAGIPVDEEKFVVISNVFYSYFEAPDPDPLYALGESTKLLAHELGHALGLFHHTQDNGHCCDTWNFGNTNNMMDGWPDYTRALSRCQLARINYFLEGKCGANGDCTDLYKAVITDYCNKDESYDIIITNDAGINGDGQVVWDVDKKLTTDVIVKTGAQLTIRCRIGLPTDANIIVERGARLFVDGGTITHNKTMWDKCDEGQWGRIYVMGNDADLHYPGMESETYPLFPNGPGFVILKEATLEYARHAISTRSPWTDNYAYHGGFVYAEKSYFYNNYRSAEFRKYDFQNYSAFIGCTFENDDGTANYGISNWATKGIRVHDCAFKRLNKYGVLTFNASMDITGSDFSGIEHAIDCSNTLGETHSVNIGHENDPALRNEFSNNIVGVYGSTINRIFVLGNVFLDNVFGVCVNGLSGYAITNNKFFNSSAAIDLEQTGGILFDKSIDCNIYGDDFFGINARGDNTNMFFTRQEFDNTYDVHYSNFFGISGSFSDQQSSNQLLPAVWNYFTQAGFNIFHINSTGNTDFFKYHHPDPSIDPDPSIIPKCDINSTCNVANNFENQSDQGESSACGNTQLPPGGPITKERLLEIKTQIAALQGVPGSEEILATMEAEKDRVFWGLVHQYQEQGDHAEVESLLVSEENIDTKRYLIGFKQETGALTEAGTLIANYPLQNSNDNAFVTIALLNLDRKIQEGDYVLTETDEEKLRTIADGETPESFYAKGLLT
ncbi:MAG: hypothetical protein KDC85_08205, partial [Saprospiraceae bacterium]|nr:hypothetical protein [Saprospiraceae bacterium]